MSQAQIKAVGGGESRKGKREAWMEACRLTVRQAELISSLARSASRVCGGARGRTRAPGIQGTGWGFRPAAHTPHPDTSDHISPWEPGGPGGSCRGGREGMQSLNVVFLAVMCVCCMCQDVCMWQQYVCVCVCARVVPFFIWSLPSEARNERVWFIIFLVGSLWGERWYTITERKGVCVYVCTSLGVELRGGGGGGELRDSFQPT